jgi:DNA adenine methylase
MKPFIRWPGTKSRRLIHILPLIPKQFNTYIEPFLGGGALLLRLQPTKWIINDLNKDLINVWTTIKSRPKSIINYFQKQSISFLRMSKLERLAFVRNELVHFVESPYNHQRAAQFIFLKYCAYMGHILIENKYQITSLDPKAYNRSRLYFFTDTYYKTIQDVSTFLNTTTGKIYNEDYKRVLAKAKEGDFVFLDPPYEEKNNYKFNYNVNTSQADFLQNLKRECQKLDAKGVAWLMTQADTKQVRNIFSNYTIQSYPVYRRQAKQYKLELIIRNY